MAEMDYVSGQELIDYLADQGDVETLDQLTELGFRNNGKLNNGNDAPIAAPLLIASTAAVATYPNLDPIAAVAQYIRDYGQQAITVLGAAGTAIAGKVGTLAAQAKVVAGEAGAMIGGALAMDIGTAFAAIAPLLGVAVGAGLYNANPEFWTKVSQTLLPWAYDGTQTIPAYVDANGNTYVDEGMINSLKELFNEEGIGTDDGTVISDSQYGSAIGQTVYLGMETGGYTSGGYPYKITGMSGSPVLYRTNNVDINGNYGVICIGGSCTIGADGGVIGGTYNNGVRIYSPPIYVGRIVPSGIDDFDLLVNIVTNAQSVEPVQAFPEGTSAWTGDSVDYTQNTIDVITTTAGGTRSYTPVAIPAGAESVDPDTHPNPTITDNPDVVGGLVLPNVSVPDVVGVPNVEDGTLVAPLTGVPTWTSIEEAIGINQALLNPSLSLTEAFAGVLAETLSNTLNFPLPIPAGLSPLPALPVAPDINGAGSGMIHIYNPTSSEFVAFGRWLWVTFADTSWTDWQKIWNNPFDGVIGAHELYVTPTTDGTDNIRSGFLACPTTSKLVSERYSEIDCGTIVIPEFYGNYLDYSPYSKAHAYLPFIGIVELNVDDIVGHAVNIKYRIDAYNGSCIAMITVAKEGYRNLCYQFSGNCAVDIPLAGGSQAAIRAGLISAAAYGISSTVNGIIGGAMRMGGVGAFAGGITGAVGGVAGGIANAVSQKSSVQHSGSFGASYGAMGGKIPFIIIRRPIQAIVPNYHELYGYPAHKYSILGACHGFTRVLEVHVDSATATDEEKAEIERLLKEGVYVD